MHVKLLAGINIHILSKILFSQREDKNRTSKPRRVMFCFEFDASNPHKNLVPT